MVIVTSINVPNDNVQETLEAHAVLWNQTLSFIKPMSLKCAIELHIPDAIHLHGMPITISDLVTFLSIPEAKSRRLRILMRILSQEGIFKSHITLSGEETFDLTPVSRLLITSIPHNRPNSSPFILLSLDHHLIDPHHQLSKWFHRPDTTTTPFEMAHGKTFWDLAEAQPEFNDLFNKAMESDSEFVVNIITNIGGEAFCGIGTLVDIGGGTGLMAATLAKAFPGLKCTVFDLPHVISTVEKKTEGIQFVAGDMFIEVPPADVILLKGIVQQQKGHEQFDEVPMGLLRRILDSNKRVHEAACSAFATLEDVTLLIFILFFTDGV